MTAELLKALAVILEVCLKQDKCSECPLRDYCERMPCDWN